MRYRNSTEKAEAWSAANCECGNGSMHEGFYLSDIDGRAISTGTLLCCHRCGKIIDQSSGRYVGHRSFAPREIFEDIGSTG